MDRTGATLFLLVLAATSMPAAATARAREAASVTILDVPFVPQSEQLCGGAAAAMVMRYWGARATFAEDFASLVEPGGAGVRGDVLADAVRERGWIAQSLRGSETLARDHLAAGRPLITLIEDRPGRYHFVVLVGWAGERVILHDPADAPFRVVAESDFSTAWAAGGFWTLLILPHPDTPTGAAFGQAPSAAADAPASPTDDCGGLVLQGVRAARSGHHDVADALLSAAIAECPASPAAARELAGLRFLQSRWRDAARLAARAAEQAPDDVHAWQLLASSRFVQDDDDGALEAWNRIGQPRVDLVRIEGLARTRHAVVEELLALKPLSGLSAADLRRARRRLGLLPVSSASRVGYRPAPGGLADVDAAILERPSVPGRAALGAAGVHALIERELVLGVSAPAGSGTRLLVGWRWWNARPRIGFSLLTPSAFGHSGLWRLDGFRARQSYALDRLADVALVHEDRQRLALSYTDWMAADRRVTLGAAFDRWNHSRPYAEAFGSLEQRLAADRVAVQARAAIWSAPGAGRSFGTGGVEVLWRSLATTSGRQPMLTARAGFESASVRAPLDVWPGADVDDGRAPVARAHPVLAGGVIRGGLFGRSLVHGGAELQPATRAAGPVRTSVAIFADVARAWRPSGVTAADLTQVDVGLGLRLRVAGHAPMLRIDVAYGLRDGRTVVSAGWQLPWAETRWPGLYAE
jgi:hypothetical protein